MRRNPPKITADMIMYPEEYGLVVCPHCNGYGSSLQDPEGVNTCTMCGGFGVVKAETKSNPSFFDVHPDPYGASITSRAFGGSPVELDQLADYADYRVRYWVAANKLTRATTLAKLAFDENVDVRWYVAFNLNTSPATLAQLALDDVAKVRQCVAENIHTPPIVLARLAQDENVGVRIAVVYNENTPPEALAELTDDTIIMAGYYPGASVGEVAHHRLKGRGFVKPHPAFGVRYNPSFGLRDALDYNELKMSRADDASTPVDILATLAEDEDELIRCHVAFNRSTPQWLLVQLARDSDWLVRQHAALNRLTPHEILTELARDDNQYVRWAAEKTLKYKHHPAFGVRYNPRNR